MTYSMHGRYLFLYLNKMGKKSELAENNVRLLKKNRGNDKINEMFNGLSYAELNIKPA